MSLRIYPGVSFDPRAQNKGIKNRSTLTRVHPAGEQGSLGKERKGCARGKILVDVVSASLIRKHDRAVVA